MVPDTLLKEYLRCWIHRPAGNSAYKAGTYRNVGAFLMQKKGCKR